MPPRILKALFLTLSAGAAAQTPFCDQLRALTQDPTVAAAHWGLQVTDLKGTPLCSVNEAQLFRPASNNKIFTTATALALLSPDRTFQTRVTGNLDGATGIVTGDLTLVGGGDANLDSGDLPYRTPADRARVPPSTFAFHDLEDLAAQLAAKGVKSITGNIVGDDTLFPYEPYPESWSADDLTWGYGAPVSALTIVDNQLRLTVTATAAGQPATVTLDQHGVDYYTVVSQVTTASAKDTHGVGIERPPGSRTVRIYGTFPQDAPPEVEQIAIADPALYAAVAFRTVLATHGIATSGTVTAKHQPSHNGTGFLARLNTSGGPETNIANGGGTASSCLGAMQPPTLATHTSGPLPGDITLTDKVSQNLHAELLFHQLGRLPHCEGGSIVQAARMVRAFLLHAGLAPDDFLFYDGSGLSDHDLVAPRAIARFLAFAATQPWFPAFKSSLPVGGVDGSLASRFTGPATKGRVFAKTGSLGESRALSGYLTAASGRTLIFSILVDTHLPGSTADRTVMDRMVESIAAQN